MLTDWKRIIRHMLEFSKRWGPVLLGAFVTSVVGIIPALIFLTNLPLILTLVILGILAIVFLIGTIIALYYDLKDARKRDSQSSQDRGFMDDTPKSRSICHIRRLGSEWKNKQLKGNDTRPSPSKLRLTGRVRIICEFTYRISSNELLTACWHATAGLGRCAVFVCASLCRTNGIVNFVA